MEFSNWLFVLRVHVHYTTDGIRDSNLLNLACTDERMRLRCREPISHFHQSGSTNGNWTMYFVSNISGVYRIGHYMSVDDVCRVITKQWLLFSFFAVYSFSWNIEYFLFRDDVNIVKVYLENL